MALALVAAGIVNVVRDHQRDRDAATSPAASTSVSPQQAALPPLPSLPDSYNAPVVSNPTIPPAGRPPDGLGSDAALNRLAQSCYEGSMADCDALFRQAPQDSSYQQYGDTCAGRQPAGTSAFCTDAFPS